VVACCECGDAPSGSGATELVNPNNKSGLSWPLLTMSFE
jgi:hypothetical protein